MKKLFSNPFYEVLTEEGFKPFDGILVSENRKTIDISINGKSLTCTPDHKIKFDRRIYKRL